MRFVPPKEVDVFRLEKLDPPFEPVGFLFPGREVSTLRLMQEKAMTEHLIFGAIEWRYLLGSTPLEIIATLCGVTGVILIAREKILGWPIGIAWAAISTYLAMVEWQLVSDGILYATYIPIQIYCWVVWHRRGSGTLAEEKPFVPTWLPLPRQAMLIVVAAAAIVLWAAGITLLASHVSWIPEPSLLWRDSTTTVLNYFAQFLQARKRMENWVGWLIVNVLGIHIYWIKDAPLYSIQYALLLGLGIYGWVQWQKSIKQHQP
ncbi:MAG: nicotinamide mononucleotide transporter [Kiritimatiellae bacterium]|nr:nicotinamide mononucleotide transporter [Kiritimatiellia bacterium]